MQRWEYCLIRHTNKGMFFIYYTADGSYDYRQIHADPTRSDENYQHALLSTVASLGSDGWELVNVCLIDSVNENWYFKRPI